MRLPYDEFEADSLALYRESSELRALQFDPNKDYTQQQLTDAIFEFVGDGRNMSDRYAIISEAIFSKIESEPTQSELNQMYRGVQELLQSEKGSGPVYDEGQISQIANAARSLDAFITSYLEASFAFYKPEYGNILFEANPSASLNLLINDSYLKFECFIATSLATLGHLLREVCNPAQGFLARVILGRSLFESAIHQLFLTRKFSSLAVCIEKKDFAASHNELSRFREMFARGMCGTGSPYVPTADPSKPFNILSCMECLDKNEAFWVTPKLAKEFYSHLCDFAHPNLGMRSLFFEFGAVPGDFYSVAIKIDRSMHGRLHAATQNDILLRCVSIVHTVIECALDEKETTRHLLNQKNVQTFGTKRRFNAITNLARATLDPAEGQ